MKMQLFRLALQERLTLESGQRRSPPLIDHSQRFGFYGKSLNAVNDSLTYMAGQNYSDWSVLNWYPNKETVIRYIVEG